MKLFKYNSGILIVSKGHLLWPERFLGNEKLIYPRKQGASFLALPNGIRKGIRTSSSEKLTCFGIDGGRAAL